MTKLIGGLHEIAGRFDAVIFDQWGVLHNGVEPLPGALETLMGLKARGMPVGILSNSGKRNAANAARMASLGIASSTYDALLTSGEYAWHLLAERRQAPFNRLGPRCYLIAQKGAVDLVTGNGLAPVKQLTGADFVLVAGCEKAARREDFSRILAEALAAGIPLLCANPDFDAIHGERTAFGPGRLALAYEEMGGEVHRIGKPDPAVFRALAKEMGLMPEARILMVGDSLHHDIAGGAAAGYATLFVTTGVHRASFERANDPLTVLGDLPEQGEARPDFLMTALAP